MRFMPSVRSVFRACTFAGAVLAAGLIATLPAHAAEHRLGKFKDWEAFVYKTDKQKVCYIYSTPEKSEGKYTKRGQTYVMVTHHPKSKDLNVVNVVAGYTYKLSSEVELEIDGSQTKLFTDQDSAWAVDDATDNKIVKMMRKGSKLVVEGRSSRGTLTKDVYSLSGFTAAHQAASKACGVRA